VDTIDTSAVLTPLQGEIAVYLVQCEGRRATTSDLIDVFGEQQTFMDALNSLERRGFVASDDWLGQECWKLVIVPWRRP
jgi:hypothetical protein